MAKGAARLELAFPCAPSLPLAAHEANREAKVKAEPGIPPEYWHDLSRLPGYEAMRSAARGVSPKEENMVTAEKVDLKQEILGWVDEQLSMGDSLDDAAGTVAARIVREGHAEAAISEFGTMMVRDFWRQHNRNERRSAALPGERRVDAEALRESMLESLYKIGDEWVRLGDCDASACREAQRWFAKQAEGSLREAYMFGKLADTLKKGQVVRSRFDDEQLRGLLQSFRLE